MAILTTTITLTLTLTHQTGQRQVLNHSQTNSQVEGQPNRFCVCCFVHICIALCKILVGWSLCCYILYIISWYISVCFITLMFRFKSDIQEVGFQSSCPNSALSAGLSLNLRTEALCLVHKISLQSSMYANIIAPGASFHTLNCNTSINIRSKNRLNINN